MSGRAERMKLVKELKKQGFSVERTGSGHWKVTYPGRQGVVIMGFSPSGSAQHKTLKHLRGLGFEG